MMAAVATLSRPGTAAPPFARGQRIVERNRPTMGALLVGECKPHPRGGWIIEALCCATGFEKTVYPEQFVAAPSDWCEPPQMPTRPDFAVECTYDGPVPAGARAAAASPQDQYDRVFAEWALAMADWWDWVGREVRPDLADGEIRKLRATAAKLSSHEREAA